MADNTQPTHPQGADGELELDIEKLLESLESTVRQDVANQIQGGGRSSEVTRIIYKRQFKDLIAAQTDAAYKTGLGDGAVETTNAMYRLIDAARLDEAKWFRKSYPKKRATANSISRLSLGELDAHITELSQQLKARQGGDL